MDLNDCLGTCELEDLGDITSFVTSICSFPTVLVKL